MKVILNKILPIGPKMLAINLFGVVLAKRPLTRIEAHHEYIHTLQQRELLYVGFYILYVGEWLIRLVQKHGWIKGYLAISFEREAYRNETNLDYEKTRPRFAWRRYL